MAIATFATELRVVIFNEAEPFTAKLAMGGEFRADRSWKVRVFSVAFKVKEIKVGILIMYLRCVNFANIGNEF